MSRSEQSLEMETDAIVPAASCDPSFMGLLAQLAALTMLFAAFSSAYIVRRGMSTDWTPLQPSAQLWIIAIPLLLGSTILESGRRSFARHTAYIAIAFGTLAGAILIQSWRQLMQTGASAAASPAVAFYYIFSVGFLLCLIGAISALLRATAGRTITKCSALYWHYVTVLWLWVMMLFGVYR